MTSAHISAFLSDFCRRCREGGGLLEPITRPGPVVSPITPQPDPNGNTTTGSDIGNPWPSLCLDGCGLPVYDPVILPAGEYEDSGNDYGSKGIGFGFSLSRRYGSFGNEVTGPFGSGWQSDLHCDLVEDESTDDVTICCLYDAKVTFTKDGDDYVPPPQVKETLEADGTDGYTLTFLDTAKWYFQSTGERTKIENRVGNTMIFEYDGSGDLTGVTDTVSANHKLEYDAGHRLTKYTKPNSALTYSYEYDNGADLLTRVSSAWGGGAPRVRNTYEYVGSGDNIGRLSRKTISQNCLLIENTYDSEGRVITQTTYERAAAGTYAYDYGGTGGLHITTTTPIGTQQIRIFEEGESGRKELVTKTVCTNLGIRSGEADYTTSYYYEADTGQRLTTSGASGATKIYEYDDAGNVTSVMVDPAAGVGDESTIVHYYESTHNVVTRSVYPGSYTVDYEYDAMGLPTKVTSPDVEMGQASTQTVAFAAAYDSRGLKTQSVDANDVVAAYFYDGNGNVTKTIQDEGGLNKTFEMAYDATGNMTELVGPTGQKAWSWYDGFGLLTKEAMILDNNNPTKQHAVSYWYDDRDKVISKKVENKDGNGNSLTPTEYLSQYAYDNGGSLTRSIYQVDATNFVTKDYCYDFAGMLTKLVKGDGNEESFVYDERGLLCSKSSCGGCGGGDAVTFDYDGNGRVVTQTTAAGMKTVYDYDNGGRVTCATIVIIAIGPNTLRYTVPRYDAYGNVTDRTIYDRYSTAIERTSYYYDELNRLYETRAWVDPAGTQGNNDERDINVYDPLGRVITQRSVVSGTDASPTYEDWAYIYDSTGNLITAADPLGQTHATVYDDTGRVLTKEEPSGATTVYAYHQALGKISRETYPDSTYFVREYDSMGNVLTTTSYTSSGNVFAKEAYEYNSAGKVLSQRAYANPTGAADDNKDHKVAYTYEPECGFSRITDADSNHWTFLQDSDGRLECERDPLGNKTEYVYDDDGNIITSIRYEIDTYNSATRQFKVAKTYDAWDRLTRKETGGADGDLATSSDNGVISYYYDAMDRLTKVADVYGVAVVSMYDGLGRLTRSTADPAGIDAHSDLLYNRIGIATKAIDANGNETAFAYDALARPTRITDAAGNYTANYYDAADLLTRRVNYGIDQAGGGPGSQTIDYSYDIMGRVTETTKAGVSSATYYDAAGRFTRVVGADSTADAWVYDGLGRLTRQVADVTGAALSTDYMYSQLGRLTRVTDTRGKHTDYSYDAIGRVEDETYEDGTEVRLRYAFGDTLSYRCNYESVPNSKYVRYLYDGAGQLTRRQDGLSSATITEDYEYDLAGRQTRSVVSHSGTEKAEVIRYFDNLSRLTRETQQIREGTARHVDMAYDAGGNRLTLTYPQAKDVVYTHDVLNRVSTISDGSDERAVYKYFGKSRLSEKVLKNGASTVSTYELTYNSGGHATSALYRNSADTATIIGFEHDYDNMGNPEYEVRVHESDYGDEYTYDSLYRVTRTVYDDSTPTTPTASPAAAETEDFVYDDVGNRLTAYLKSATATTYQYNDVNECTKRDLNDTINHDYRGNMTFDSEYNYYYDHLNRVTKINTNSNPSLAVAYLYDADGRLVERTIYDGAAGTSYVQYFYDGLAVIEEREDDGTLVATYINGARIDEYILMNRDSTDYWYMQSPIVGNVAALVNSSGEIQEGYKYRAYGQASVLTSDGDDDTWFTSDDDSATTSALGNPYTFNGRRLESVSLDLYYRNRVLHRNLGRFTSRDPLGHVDGMNLYEYVNSNPVRLMDPLGLVVFRHGDTIWGSNNGMKTRFRNLYCSKGKKIKAKKKTFIGSYRYRDSMVDIGGYEVPYIRVKNKEAAEGCMTHDEWYRWAKVVGYNPRGFEGALDAGPQGLMSTGEAFGQGLHDGSLATTEGMTFNLVQFSKDRYYKPYDPTLQISRGCGAVATTSLMMAGGSAFFPAHASITVGSGSPFHVVYGVGSRTVHAVGTQFFRMKVATLGARAAAQFGPYVTLSGIPVLYPDRVTMTGQRAWSCLTAALHAIARGWGLP